MTGTRLRSFAMRGLAAWTALSVLPLAAGAVHDGGQAGRDGGAAGEAITVYLVTFGPGPRVWERFGHNGLWIRDTVTGDGPIYDYGRFSFEEENFLLEFALGNMQYWMGRDDGVALINRYLQAGRSVWLQELALPPAARIQLLDSLEANLARDQGRYRYDYYRDNCSTRIRDAIDRATGGAVRARLEPAASGTSYRFHTRRSLEHNLAFYAPVMAALGAPADRPISPWEEAFLPMELQRHLREVMVPDSGGHPIPLVAGEVTVAETDRYLVPTRPGRRPMLVLLTLGLALGLAIAVLGYLGRSRPAARRGFVLLSGAWELAALVVALLILWFWVLSHHEAAHQNANIFQFNLLAGGVLVGLSRFGAGARNGDRWLRPFAIATAGVALLGPVVEVLSGWNQSNAEVTGLSLPLHLGVLAGALALSRPTIPSPSGAPPAPR